MLNILFRIQRMEEKKFIVVVFLFQLMYRLTLSQVDRFNLSAHTRLDVQPIVCFCRFKYISMAVHVQYDFKIEKSHPCHTQARLINVCRVAQYLANLAIVLLLISMQYKDGFDDALVVCLVEMRCIMAIQYDRQVINFVGDCTITQLNCYPSVVT